MGAEPTDLALPRRYEALAFIIERIVREGTSPSYDEIGEALGVRKTRARELVDQLIVEQLVERPIGKQRSFRIRDLTRSRGILADVLNRLGWADAVAMGELQRPRTHERLPRLPTIEYLPDID